MMNRIPFAIDEWYHCYARGVEKRTTFESDSDYKRFIHLLYLCNSEATLHRSDLNSHSYSEVFSLERGSELVCVGAYCLMSNHFHLLLKQNSEKGISTFMRKLGTAYTMYFNIKNERTGNLFVKPFRSRHVSDDRYIHRLVSYIHLNPLEIYEPKWKEGVVKSEHDAHNFLLNYPYSSLIDYNDTNTKRPEVNVLNVEALDFLNKETNPLSELITESVEYYQEYNSSDSL